MPLLSSSSSAYQPPPLTLLQYLATTILTVHSFPQTVAKTRAAEKSLAEPVFGLAEEKDGVLLGAGANDPRWGMVVEMEFRRKSGRTVSERFYVPRDVDPGFKIVGNRASLGNGNSDGKSSSRSTTTTTTTPMLLADHPLYRRPIIPSAESAAHAQSGGGGEGDEELISSTFDLTLTSKQRDDRAGVVLPYFDAQRGEGGGGGGGGGGRILYNMGVEDDFDEEEDEI